MTVTVLYTATAVKQLKRMEREAAQQVVAKIGFYAEQKDPLRYAKRLNPPFKDLYRFRIGEYRAIFDIDAKGTVTLLTILKVGHRKTIYT